MKMDIFDAHCDVLYKMWLNPKLTFENSIELHITGEQLRKTGGKVQCFAIYIPESVSTEQQYEVALEMVEIFYQKVLASNKQLKHVRTQKDIRALKADEIGAMLTLEGCDAIGSSLTKFKTLVRLGVSSVGLTWNYANAVADGVLEERGAGLSMFGKKIVNEANKAGIWTDVSHLSENGFWQVLELSMFPIASHSNVYSLCNHPRNLKDNQIKQLIVKNGMIGVTFVPDFLNGNSHASISDVIKHVDYICALGGVRNIGFGSDFDGITETVRGLSTYSNYEGLINELLKHFKESQVKGFLYQNFINHFPSEKQ
jgi:membrane dipeptidase